MHKIFTSLNCLLANAAKIVSLCKWKSENEIIAAGRAGIQPRVSYALVAFTLQYKDTEIAVNQPVS